MPAKAVPAGAASERPATGDKDPQGAQTAVKDEEKPKASSSAAVEKGPIETKETDEKEGPWVHDRMQTALRKSAIFDQFRPNRPFRYLHMFSGEDDQLARSLKVEAERARLQIYVVSLDRKRDSELNLASHVVYDEIESITNGEWDGFHSDFPCGSF